MNFIKNPNLPQKNVKCALCDCRVEETILKELSCLRVDVLSVPSYEVLQSPVSSHPDIHCCHVEGNVFYTSDCFSANFEKLIIGYMEEKGLCEKINNRVIKNKLGREYPNDVYLNVFISTKYIICNPKFAATEIIGDTDKEIISVKQGYTKCSILPISDDAFITDDISIYNASIKFFDVLYVEHGDVLLDGYNYGFIGGTGGKISKDTVAFFGNVKTHKNYFDIKNFCNSHNVQCISLSNDTLYDYGSLIPLFEH